MSFASKNQLKQVAQGVKNGFVSKHTMQEYNQQLQEKVGIDVLIDENGININDRNFRGLIHALKLQGVLDPSTFSDKTMDYLIKNNLIKKYFDLGDEWTTKKNNVDEIFNIIGFDQEKLVDTNIKHSVTVLKKFAPGFRWDMNELLFYVDPQSFPDGLAAGTYNITLYYGSYSGTTVEDGTYQFTISQPIPAGGGFGHSTIGQWRSAYGKEYILGNKITTYGAPDSTGYRQTIESNLDFQEGSSGTYLGRFTQNSKTYHDEPGTNFSLSCYNYTGRNGYGSNNYIESDIRKYITSNRAAGQWWSAANNFDLRHSSYNSAGYLNGFSSDFLKMLGESTKRVGVSTSECGDTSTTVDFVDKVFLLGNGEIGFDSYGTDTNLDSGSIEGVYEYFAQGLLAGDYQTKTNSASSCRIKFGSAPTNILSNGKTSQLSASSYYLIDGSFTKAYWSNNEDGSDKVEITTNSTVKFTCNDKKCVSTPSGVTGYIFLEGYDSDTKIYKSSTYWWMRSPSRGDSNVACEATPHGSYGGNVVSDAVGCSPACVLI